MTVSREEGERLARLATAIRESSVLRLRSVPHGFENWRPSSGAMSFADLAQHLIDADEWLFEKLADPDLPGMKGRPGLATVTGRDEFDAFLERLTSLGAERSTMLADLSSRELAREIPDDRFGGPVSVWWVIVRGNLDHEAHHRGQLALYLRLVGD